MYIHLQDSKHSNIAVALVLGSAWKPFASGASTCQWLYLETWILRKTASEL